MLQDYGTEHPHRVALSVHVDAVATVKASLRSGLEARGVQARLVVSGQGDWRYLDVLAHRYEGSAACCAPKHAGPPAGFWLWWVPCLGAVLQPVHSTWGLPRLLRSAPAAQGRQAERARVCARSVRGAARALRGSGRLGQRHSYARRQQPSHWCAHTCLSMCFGHQHRDSWGMSARQSRLLGRGTHSDPVPPSRCRSVVAVVGNAQPELLDWVLQQPQDSRLVVSDAPLARGILEGLARHGLY